MFPIKLPHTITNMKEKINMESTIVGSIVAWIENKQRLIHTYLHLIYCNNIMFEWKGTQLSKLKRCHQLSKLKRCHQLRILHVSHCYIYIRFINLKPFLLSFISNIIIYLTGKTWLFLSFLLDSFSFMNRMYHSVYKNIMYIKGIQSLRLIFFFYWKLPIFDVLY